jgi:hypothetical protein
MKGKNLFLFPLEPIGLSRFGQEQISLDVGARLIKGSWFNGSPFMGTNRKCGVQSHSSQP